MDSHDLSALQASVAEARSQPRRARRRKPRRPGAGNRAAGRALFWGGLAAVLAGNGALVWCWMNLDRVRGLVFGALGWDTP